MYETLNFRIKGVVPLLMYNGQLADPLNEWSRRIKEISGKRLKTDADHMEIARLEFMGGLYLHNGEPCIPGEVMEATLINAAKKHKRGQQAKAGLLCDGMYRLVYDGPKDPESLWADEKFRLRTPVKVKQAKVIRTRPRFADWEADIDVKFNNSLLNKKEIEDFVRIGGEQVGLLDWRPRFGRYEMLNN